MDACTLYKNSDLGSQQMKSILKQAEDSELLSQIKKVAYGHVFLNSGALIECRCSILQWRFSISRSRVYICDLRNTQLHFWLISDTCLSCRQKQWVEGQELWEHEQKGSWRTLWHKCFLNDLNSEKTKDFPNSILVIWTLENSIMKMLFQILLAQEIKCISESLWTSKSMFGRKSRYIAVKIAMKYSFRMIMSCCAEHSQNSIER